MGKKAKKRFTEKLRLLKINRITNRSITEIAEILNPILRGMKNYFGAYYKSELSKIASFVNFKLKKWALRKYKSRRALKWLQRMYLQNRDMFEHWKWYKPTYFFG